MRTSRKYAPNVVPHSVLKRRKSVRPNVAYNAVTESRHSDSALSGALQPVLGYMADRYRLGKIIVLSGFLLLIGLISD